MTSSKKRVRTPRAANPGTVPGLTPVRTVSLERFAALCGVNQRTMRRYLAHAPAGSAWLNSPGPGRAWAIEPVAAAEWVQVYRQQLAEARKTEPADEASVRLLTGAGYVPLEIGLTPKQQTAALDAASAALDYRERLGSLLEAKPTLDLLQDAIIRLRATLTTIAPAVRRKYGLDREAEDWILELHASALVTFTKRLDEIIEPVAA